MCACVETGIILFCSGFFDEQKIRNNIYIVLCLDIILIHLRVFHKIRSWHSFCNILKHLWFICCCFVICCQKFQASFNGHQWPKTVFRIQMVYLWHISAGPNWTILTNQTLNPLPTTCLHFSWSNQMNTIKSPLIYFLLQKCIRLQMKNGLRMAFLVDCTPVNTQSITLSP